MSKWFTQDSHLKGWYCFQNNCYKYHICGDYHFKNYYIWKQNELQGYTGQVSVKKHRNQTIYPESIQFQNFVHSFFQIIFPALEFDSENSSWNTDQSITIDNWFKFNPDLDFFSDFLSCCNSKY